MVVFKAHVQNLVVVFLIDSQYAVGMVVFKAHVQNLIVMFLIDSTSACT
jgi:siderophore synthetase component